MPTLKPTKIHDSHLKNQAVLDRIVEKNMMRRSYKDRMEAVAKKRKMKKLERLRKEKLQRKKNRARFHDSCTIKIFLG